MLAVLGLNATGRIESGQMMLFGRLKQQSGSQLGRWLQRVEEESAHECHVTGVQLGRVLAVRGAVEEQGHEEVDEVGEACGHRERCVHLVGANQAAIELFHVCLVL